MVLLQIHFEYRGAIGLLVAIVGFLAISVPLAFLVWGKIVIPLKERWYERESVKRRLAFLECKVSWMVENMTKAVFVLDKDRRCVEVNDAACALLQADSSDLLGRKWHGFIRPDLLSATLQRWDEAYKNQAPYRNISVMLINGREKRFKVMAEPFVWHGKALNYMGTLEPFDVIETKLLES